MSITTCAASYAAVRAGGIKIKIKQQKEEWYYKKDTLLKRKAKLTHSFPHAADFIFLSNLLSAGYIHV
jgi:hypothetical protein